MGSTRPTLAEWRLYTAALSVLSTYRCACVAGTHVKICPTGQSTQGNSTSGRSLVKIAAAVGTTTTTTSDWGWERRRKLVSFDVGKWIGGEMPRSALKMH